MDKLRTIVQLRNRAALLRSMAEETPHAESKEALRRAADAYDADAAQLAQELRQAVTAD